MKKRDVFTGEQFKTDDPNEVMAPATKRYIRDLFINDKKIQREVISAIVHDDEVRLAITKSILACSAEEVGLSSPGTVAEFFLRLRDKQLNGRTSKVSK